VPAGIVLLLVAVAVIYLVLGILYESLVHPRWRSSRACRRPPSAPCSRCSSSAATSTSTVSWASGVSPGDAAGRRRL